MTKAISNDTRGTSQKKFRPNPKINNGLNLAALTDVTVSTADIKDDSPMETFRGVVVPRLNFVFESRMDKAGVKKSVYMHSYLPIEHTPESITKGRDGGTWRWDQMSQTIKHFLEVFRDYAPFTKEEELLLTVDFEDENDGVFVEQPAEVVIASYEKFFNNIVALFKPGDKAIYKDINGKDKIIWLKLLLDIKGKLINNGDYGIAGYPGEGSIELYIKDVEPSLYVNVSKGENIEPRTAAPAAAVSAPSGVVTESNIPDFMRKS